MKRKKIAVAPEAEFQSRRRLFSLLSELYPVDFEIQRQGNPVSCDGAILWEGCTEEKEIASTLKADCLVVARSTAVRISVQKRTVKFGTSAALDRCFRGQTMIEECVDELPPLQLCDGDELVCSLDSQPCWLVRRSDGRHISIVALPPEEFAEGQTVYYHFNRRRWLRLLPFLNFLKRLTADENWEQPPVRACLMFDDPNLHWPTYGFLDYRKLAQHAREHNYHVAFAMVPLNAGFSNSTAAELFKQHRERLSLCMHGNNHSPAELAAPLNESEFTKLFAQALRRIDGFEKRSGVCVSRVMVPPNGAFAENAADSMLNLGYEAVCVSRSSLTAWNKNKTWPASFGHPAVEFLGGGLPVIPRQVMAAGHEGTYRLAAFLNQPIIPHAHHQDCADGLDLLERVARSINAIGNVTWCDMEKMSRTNYLSRRDGDTLSVKMLSRRISIELPTDVKRVVIERPWLSAKAANETLLCKAEDKMLFSALAGRWSESFSTESRRIVEVISSAPLAVDANDVPAPSLPMWTFTRRALSEARDRIAPLTSRLNRKRRDAKPLAVSQNVAS